jgi:hypothetical protein
MEWIIESYDRGTDRDGHNRFTSESAFMSAAEELYQRLCWLTHRGIPESRRG